MEHKKSYFWFSRLSGVTIGTSLSGSTRDFLKLSFYMFPCNAILYSLLCRVYSQDLHSLEQNAGGALPISHDALDRIIYIIFPPFCQVIPLLF